MIPHLATQARLQALAPDLWLQSLLQRPCFTLTSDWTSDGLLAELPRGRVFVSAKVPVAPLDESLTLQELGFHVVDTALTFEATDLAEANDRRIRPARAEDREAVQAIARGSFRSSRFHLDPALSGDADRIKAAWADNYFAGQRGDILLVAEQRGDVVGFLQALRTADGALAIDLIAVKDAASGQGLARAMIARLARERLSERPPLLLAGTQAANLRACRLYESLGFRLAAAKTVLHFHGRGV